MSHELNRFVDLTESEKKHLSCSICFNIFNNAVISECGHTFCRTCIQHWIRSLQSERKDCPQCRKQFTRKRRNETANDNNSIIISNVVFTRNLAINAMVEELKIKCFYDFNGCLQILKLGSLSSHLSVCEYRLCTNCELTFGKLNEHNCLEALKKERNQMKDKINSLEEELKKSSEKIKQLETKCGESNKIFDSDDTTDDHTSEHGYSFRRRPELHLIESPLSQLSQSGNSSDDSSEYNTDSSGFSTEF